MTIVSLLIVKELMLQAAIYIDKDQYDGLYIMPRRAVLMFIYRKT